MSLSKPPSLCYDLSYLIAEKWVLSFITETNKKNEYKEQLIDFQFLKLMLVNRQFKAIFLRILKSNFNEAHHEIYHSGYFCRILSNIDDATKPIAPLFRGIGLTLGVGWITESKWLFAFLHSVGVLPVLNSVVISHFLLNGGEWCASPPFDAASESALESLLLVAFRKKKDFNKLKMSGVHMESSLFDSNRAIENLHKSLVDEPPSGIVERLFNVNAKEVGLRINATAQYNVAAFPTIKINHKTEQIQIFVTRQFISEDSGIQVAAGNAWKNTLLYGLATCPVRVVSLHMTFVSVAGRFQFGGSFARAVLSILEWVKEEAMPKLGADGKFMVGFNIVEDPFDETCISRLRHFLVEHHFISGLVEERELCLSTWTADADDSRLKQRWFFNRDCVAENEPSSDEEGIDNESQVSSASSAKDGENDDYPN